MQLHRTYKPYITKSFNTAGVLTPGRSYFRFAARETCLARDELSFSWFVDHGLSRCVDIPNGDIYDYYLDQATGLQTLQALADSMERNWTAHDGRYRVLCQRLLRTLHKLLLARLTRRIERPS